MLGCCCYLSTGELQVQGCNSEQVQNENLIFQSKYNPILKRFNPQSIICLPWPGLISNVMSAHLTYYHLGP